MAPVLGGFRCTVSPLVNRPAISLEGVELGGVKGSVEEDDFALDFGFAQFFKFLEILNFDHLSGDAHLARTHRIAKCQRPQLHRAHVRLGNAHNFPLAPNPVRNGAGLQPDGVEAERIEHLKSVLNSGGGLRGTSQPCPDFFCQMVEPGVAAAFGKRHIVELTDEAGIFVGSRLGLREKANRRQYTKKKGN